MNCKSATSPHQRAEPHGQPAPWELEAQTGCREPHQGQLPGAGSRSDTCTVTDNLPRAGRGELDTLGTAFAQLHLQEPRAGPRSGAEDQRKTMSCFREGHVSTCDHRLCSQ